MAVGRVLSVNREGKLKVEFSDGTTFQGHIAIKPGGMMVFVADHQPIAAEPLEELPQQQRGRKAAATPA